MSQTPRLRDLVELPGSFIFKIIVKPSRVDGDHILSLTKSRLGRDLCEPKLTLRPSSKGGYHSYTLTIFLERIEELESLYQAYSEREGVVMVI